MIMNKCIREMSFAKALGILLYPGLFLVGLWVSRDSFQEYINGGTGHTNIRQLLSANDLPTLMTCLVYTRTINDDKRYVEYGNNFNIDAKVIGMNQVVTLIEDQYTDGLTGPELFLSKVYQTYLVEKEHMEDEEQWECYKISHNLHGFDQIDFEKFGIQLLFNMSWSHLPPDKIYIGVSSEDDSYGLSDEKWSNGNLLFPFKRLQGVWNCQISCKQRRFKIEVSESNGLIGSTCSKEPYYDCLAKKFAKLDTLAYSGTMMNGSKCKYDKKCFPFSLPPGDNEIPMCINQNESICYESVIASLENDSKERCKQLCHTKKYKVRDEPYYINDLYDYGIEYFLVAPYATKDIRFLMPFKIIHKEYLIMSMRLLIGNVGGTLSLFVGFSFISTSKSFLALCTRMAPRDILSIRRLERSKALKAAKRMVLSVGFLTGAIAFVYQSVVEYMTENTAFAETLKPISLHDLPTMTLCLATVIMECGVWRNCEDPLVYGKDFSIFVKFYAQKEYNLTLKENQFLPAFSDLDIHLSEIVRKRKIQEEQQTERWQCYKISTRKRATNEETELMDFGLQVFIQSNGKFSLVHVTFSSEKNSYGIVNERWFDGEIEFPLFSLNAMSNYNDYRRWKIAEVIDYKTISSACSNDSYYECLGKRFAAFDFTTIVAKTTNGSSCSGHRICSPFSLPNLDKIPVCSDDVARICYEDVISKLEKSQQDYCRRSCHVTEFKIEPQTDETSMIHWPETEFSFTVGFDYKLQQSTTKVRSKKPLKLVKTEYFITSLILLIGNLGGIVGLFVGISFINLFEWIYETFLPWTKIKHWRYQNTARTIFKVLLHIGLSLGAIFFMQKSIDNYQRGDTAYSMTYKPITLGDLPTSTMCFMSKSGLFGYIPLRYGQDFAIDVSISERQEQSFTLYENNHTETLFGITFYLEKIVQTMHREFLHREQEGLNWECYRVVPNWRGNDEVDMFELKIRFTFNFLDWDYLPKEVVIVTTSEENSYGIVGEKWFDGYTVFPTIIIKPSPYFAGYNILNIVDITEYQSLGATCSPDSYYQCLSKRFKSYDFGSRNDLSSNGSKCTFEHLCNPFSMPQGRNRIPMCNNEFEKSCFNTIIAELEETQEEHCKKSCLVKEFTTIEGELLREEQNIIGFQYQFVHNNTDITGTPLKSVKKEYYIMSVLSLIGNVGGILGTFIGFSFLGAYEWLMAAIKETLNRIEGKTRPECENLQPM